MLLAYSAWKTSHFFNDFKWRRMTLFSSKKIISFIKRNNIKKSNGDFYCFNCRHSFWPKNLNHINKYEKIFFCNVVMLSEDHKILKFHQCCKSYKALFIIYADLEYLIGKIGGCKTNSEKSFIPKLSKHIPSDFLMSTISSF